jgi:hypothetical protein
MVLHEGDVVDQGSDAAQWVVAMAAQAILQNAHIPNVLAVGNHDYDTAYTNRNLTTWLSNISTSYYTNEAWFDGGFYEAGRSDNVYCLRTVGGLHYLFVGLEFSPRAGVLTWLDGLLSNYADHKAIIICHAYLDGSVVADAGIYNVITQHSNVLIIGGGHYILEGTPQYVGKRDNWLVSGGHMTQFMINFQDDTEGGQGYLRIITIKPGAKAIKHQTYSPSLDNYLTGGMYEYVEVY